jgi:hypothetical protein
VKKLFYFAVFLTEISLPSVSNTKSLAPPRLTLPLIRPSLPRRLIN